MSDAVFTALLALAGTLIGTFAGIITSSKLTIYRIEQLEKKVDKHNSFGLRIPVIEESMKECERRIESIEKRLEHMD